MFGRATFDEVFFIGLFVEGFLYGLYSGIFALYLQHHASNKESKMRRNVICWSICVLYVLSTALFASDISQLIFTLLGKPIDSELPVVFFQVTLFGCCDCIAQFILIYRCWIVWGRNIRVVIIPSILTLAFIATWLAGNDSGEYISESGQLVYPGWANPVLYSSLSLSLTVNALATGLIVIRILKVFGEVKATSDDQFLGTTGGSKLRHIIFILIESGMVLFSIQLARLVVTVVTTYAAFKAYVVVPGIHEMLTGITPTIILVRTSMGLSFHDEKSMEEFAIESLHFQAASNDSNPVPEMGSIGIVGQDGGDDGVIGIQQDDGIEEVER